MVREGHSPTQEKIKELENLIAKTKYNKRTQHAIGLYKAKLAALKESLTQRAKKSPHSEGYSVKKSGDATVVLVGFPSVGKSTLLNKITNAESATADYEFTTLKVIPGLLEYGGAKIQILDVPGIVEGAAAGTGRGKEVLSVMRSSDLAIILIDATRPHHLRTLMKEVRDFGLRLNERPAIVKIKKTSKGGIDLGTTVRLTHLNKDTVVGILKEFRIMNAQVVIREDVTADRFIDAIEANKAYIPAIIILNKIDLVTPERLEELRRKLRPDICMCAETETDFEQLKEMIFQKLNFMRIFTKEQGKKADLDEPMIVRKDSTVRDLCGKLHRDFINQFRYAKVWGKSAKFPGQTKGLDHVLRDGDILEIFLR
ncbi:MAG: GTP-binding protein [Nanoarchaeota archaeon]|nr:GTP-binding protein [Nanoarchaeota archaeon]